MIDPAVTKNAVKPTTPKPKTLAAPANKKKPTLAPGSVRANAARGASEALNRKPITPAPMPIQPATPPGLDLAPTQLPFQGPPPPAIDPGMGMQPPGQLDLMPTQLPFNPNAGIAGMNPGMNNPAGSMPGQFGPVNPAVQQGLAQGRGNMARNIDLMRQGMQNRRGGY